MKLNLHFEKKKGHASPLMGFLYASLIAVSTLRGYFHLVELPWFVTQFAYIAILGLGILWVFVTAETKRINMSINIMLLQMVPNLIVLIYSVGLWVSREESLSLIMRGSSLVVYQLLLLLMLISAGIMFGDQAIEYSAFGLILANTLILLDVMRRFGVGTTVTGMIQFLASAGSQDNTISRKLEVQDPTFGIGILFTYYLIEGKNEHWRWFYIIALGFYMLTGFKRILFPAIGVGVIYYYLIRQFPEKTQIGLTVLIGVVLIVISMGYVVLVRTGLWFDICDMLGIDLMGRQRLYHHVESYYTISPGYLGLGNGMVSKVLEVVETTGNRRLHSDVLRMYIELGMPAFLLWCFILFIYTYLHFAFKHSVASARFYMVMTLLMFITFLTDNTLEKYCPQIAWHVIPLGMAIGERERLSASLDNSFEAIMEKLSAAKKEPEEDEAAVQQVFASKSKDEEKNPNENVAEHLAKFRREISIHNT